MKISIIIINFNGLKDTLECLQTVVLAKQNLDLKVFVVDYSHDLGEAKKMKQAFPEVDVIKKQKNLGFAGGNNVGIKAALRWGAEYVILLNNDTLISPDLIAKLVEYVENNPQVGCASPKIYFAKGHEFHHDKYNQKDLGQILWYAGGQLDWHNMYASHVGVDEVDRGQHERTTETEFLTGCCMIIRRQVLETVGFLHEGLFLYWADTDFPMRVKKAGWQLVYYPQAVLWHKNAGSSGSGSPLQTYFTTRNRLWFGMHYAPLRTKLALFRQSLLQLVTADPWVRRGVLDYYFGKMGIGSWK